MTEKILLVDDDPNLLDGLRRHFRRRYDLTIAEGGENALSSVREAGPFAVAVVDMRMPGMDGIQLLQRIREMSPNTIRMMLTGNADQQTAVDAINQGNIFRFYSKPCDPDTLAAGIDAGLDQYRLVVAEQELLQTTLTGSVKVLVDVLSMVDPISFGRAEKLRDWADTVARPLKPKQPWRLIVAAMLSQLGSITLPGEIMIKVSEGKPLSDGERALIDEAPKAARELIANIPRLRSVAEIVYLQNRGFDGTGVPEDGPTGLDIPVEARILKILVDLERSTKGAFPGPDAFRALTAKEKQYDPDLLAEIRSCLEKKPNATGAASADVLELPVKHLISGYVLLSDLRLDNGHLILGSGIRLSQTHIQKIHAFAKMHKFEEPIKVLRSSE